MKFYAKYILCLAIVCGMIGVANENHDAREGEKKAEKTYRDRDEILLQAADWVENASRQDREEMPAYAKWVIKEKKAYRTSGNKAADLWNYTWAVAEFLDRYDIKYQNRDKFLDLRKEVRYGFGRAPAHIKDELVGLLDGFYFQFDQWYHEVSKLLEAKENAIFEEWYSRYVIVKSQMID